MAIEECTYTVSDAHMIVHRDFGVRYCNALNEYAIFGELHCGTVIFAEVESIRIRIERTRDDGRVDYIVHNVLYASIEDVAERAFLAMSLASEMLANSGQVFNFDPAVIAWAPSLVLAIVTVDDRACQIKLLARLAFCEFIE